MNLNLNIIVKSLTNFGYKTSFFHLSKTTVHSVRMYCQEPLQKNLLYIVRPEHLAFLNDSEKNCTLISYSLPYGVNYTFHQNIIIVHNDLTSEKQMNELNAIFDSYNRWEASLSNCSHSYEGLQHMLDISAQLIGGNFILADNCFNYQLFTHAFAPMYQYIVEQSHGRPPEYITDDILTNPEYHKVRGLREPFYFPVHSSPQKTSMAYCVNLFREQDTEYYGRLMYYEDSRDEFDEGTCYLVYFLSRKVNLIYSNLSPRLHNNPIYNSLRETIKSCIPSPPSAELFIETVIKNAGWETYNNFLLLKFTSYFTDSKREFNDVAINELEFMYPECCALTYDDSLVLMVNLTKSKLTRNAIFHKKFLTFLRDRLYKAGISNIFNSFSGICSAYQEASAALLFGNIRNGMFWYYEFGDYAIDYMISRSSTSISKVSLCHPELIHLRQYDKNHGTDYYHALYEYLKARQNVTHAANALFIHRTTLLKYLDKIYSITNLNLDDWNTRLHLMLSYQILESRDTL